jgi:transcriptional regulator with XRE-family HTH domain
MESDLGRIDRQRFAAALRKWMKRTRVTQVELANRTGATQPAVSGWLKGSAPNEENLRAVLRETSIPLDEIMTPGAGSPEARLSELVERLGGGDVARFVEVIEALSQAVEMKKLGSAVDPGFGARAFIHQTMRDRGGLVPEEGEPLDPEPVTYPYLIIDSMGEDVLEITLRVRGRLEALRLPLNVRSSAPVDADKDRSV